MILGLQMAEITAKTRIGPPILTLGPMATPLKNKNFEILFFLHVTRGMKRHSVAKCHDPMSSNG